VEEFEPVLFRPFHGRDSTYVIPGLTGKITLVQWREGAWGTWGRTARSKPRWRRVAPLRAGPSGKGQPASTHIATHSRCLARRPRPKAFCRRCWHCPAASRGAGKAGPGKPEPGFLEMPEAPSAHPSRVEPQADLSCLQ